MYLESISPMSSGISRPGSATPRLHPRAERPPRAEVPPPDLRAEADELKTSVAPGGTGETPGQRTEAWRARLDAAVSRLEGLNHSLTFRVHEDSGQLMVQVVDRQTGQVLREAPPEEFLDLVVRLREMVGFFLDEMR